MTEQEQTQEERKRKRRKCIDTHSKEEEIIQDCMDAEKAFTTRDAYDYTAKEKVVSATKKQAELIYKEYKGTDRLDAKLRGVSSMIREKFENEGHKREATRIIHEVFGGKYTRRYTKDDQKLLREGKMQEYPECTDLAMDLMESFDEQKRLIDSDVVPYVDINTGGFDNNLSHTTTRDELDDKTKEVRDAAVGWSRRQDIPWKYQERKVLPEKPWITETPADTELPDDNDPTKKKVSLKPGKGPNDSRQTRLVEITENKISEWKELLARYLEDIKTHTPSDKTLERIIFGIERETRLLKWIVDNRRSMDPQQWIRFVEKSLGVDNLKSTVEIRQPKYTIDLDTGNVECKDPFRGEQIINIVIDPDEMNEMDDKQVQHSWEETIMVKKFNDLDYVLRHDHFISAAYEGFRDRGGKKKGILERKKDVSPTQSESAFGRR